MNPFKIIVPVVVLIVGLLIGLSFSGEEVEVPPAHIGKLSTESGLQEGLIQPSKFRLEGWCLICDTLILAEASDYAVKETLTIYMPKDELNLTVDVRGIFAVSSAEANVSQVFSRVPASPTNNDRISIIPMVKVYSTYGQSNVRETVRGVLTKYSIAQVMENRDDISLELTKAVRVKLKITPINAIQFGLADLQPPQVIVDERIQAKKREIAIRTEEAEKQIKLKRAEADLEVAAKQQQVDLKEAETQVLVNKKLTEGVNQAFVLQRWLKVMDQLSRSTEGKVIFMPLEAMQNPALIMGPLQNTNQK